MPAHGAPGVPEELEDVRQTLTGQNTVVADMTESPSQIQEQGKLSFILGRKSAWPPSDGKGR